MHYAISKEQIEEALKNTSTLGASAKYLSVDWRTFKKFAQKYELYYKKRYKSSGKFDLLDILAGKYPQYPTSKLSKRLVKDGYKEYKCEKCYINSWEGSPISLELNHIDGNNANHSLVNLQLLCPNCHSQTETYRNKKPKIRAANRTGEPETP